MPRFRCPATDAPQPIVPFLLSNASGGHPRERQAQGRGLHADSWRDARELRHRAFAQGAISPPITKIFPHKTATKRIAFAAKRVPPSGSFCRLSRDLIAVFPVPAITGRSVRRKAVTLRIPSSARCLRRVRSALGRSPLATSIQADTSTLTIPPAIAAKLQGHSIS